jgi:hypothetical protein
MKGNMEDKIKKKKEKNESKVRDLKPVKDPKGGVPPDPWVPVAAGITSRHRGKASESKSRTVVRCRGAVLLCTRLADLPKSEFQSGHCAHSPAEVQR